MKTYSYTVTIKDVGSIDAENEEDAKRLIIESYEDNNAEVVPCEDEIEVKEER